MPDISNGASLLTPAANNGSSAYAKLSPPQISLILPPPIRSIPERGTAEHKLMTKLSRQITDAADAMVIPRENGALGIARYMSDQIYCRHKARPAKLIPHQPLHASDPGTVLVHALRHFSNAIFTAGSASSRPDIAALAELRDALDFFLGIPSAPDVRRLPLFALRTMVVRLIDYYA